MACGKRLFLLGYWQRQRSPLCRCKSFGPQGQTRRGMDRVPVRVAARAALEAAGLAPALIAA